ncbi:hypothetical protein [Acinetobacter baumannii]|uniref:hypothetical protein n=1 Tax=Acinetobacter baumannii TaxID=470 RepID=UPI00045241A1|nr:hypothetical protein [Acinetobacter baumannii]EXA80056.1 hypothetical protein J517_4147 [Acinetobacter baumannii 118362]EXA83756.1 hypothetical protein J517_3688 [Acinetobacter baumannii 118362]EXA87205.1 hypothetical protein J517_1606 [Acinetobacter baumannii 118362]
MLKSCVLAAKIATDLLSTHDVESGERFLCIFDEVNDVGLIDIDVEATTALSF